MQNAYLQKTILAKVYKSILGQRKMLAKIYWAELSIKMQLLGEMRTKCNGSILKKGKKNFIKSN